MGKKLELKGKRFGNLLVLSEEDKRSNSGKVCWKCQCDCGRLTTTRGSRLMNGHTTSCGCLAIKNRYPPELRNHKLYGTWSKMNHRCNNPAGISYKNYGGRGVKVCDRWSDNDTKGFINFIEDMEATYRPKLTLDRVDNDMDYSPSNCKWATRVQQRSNSRMNSNNTSGVIGVFYIKGKCVWEAKLRYDGVIRSQTWHLTFDQAVAARLAAEELYWPPEVLEQQRRNRGY